MDLIERYLQAVKFWLPKQDKNDIIAELSEDLRAQIEEREGTLGRPLNESEVEAILKDRGRPIVVANRFLPQRYLIGPPLFPIYQFVLKMVGLCYLAIWLVVTLGGIFSAAIGSMQASSRVALTGFVAMGVVTLVFALIERVEAKSKFLEDWSPSKLHAVPDRNLISRTGSSLEIAVNLVIVALWANLSSRIIVIHPDTRIMLSAMWPWFFWGVLFLTLINVALSSWNLMRPNWTVSRAAFRMLIDCVGSVLFCWLLETKILSGIAVAGMSTEHAMELTTNINSWLGTLLPWSIAVCVIIAICDLNRIRKLRTRQIAATPLAVVL